MALDANILVFVLAGAVIILLVCVVYLEVRLRRLLKGKNAATLEDTIQTLLSELKELKNSRNEIENYLRSVETRLKRSIQGVKTVRFNPFKDLSIGSNQSFATAFMDEEGNGVVISSLYSRDRVSVYSKPLEKHASAFELTGEEKEAVGGARPGKV